MLRSGLWPASVVVLAWSLTGCSALWRAGWETVKPTFQNSSKAVDRLALEPGQPVLKFSVNGHYALLALGYVDRGTEVWYSADGSVVRLRDGRLEGTDGLSVDWKNVASRDAALLPGANAPVTYTRVRDEMPGYRIQLEERVRILPLHSAPSAAPKALRQPAVRWFREEVVPDPAAGGWWTTRGKPYRYPGLYGWDVSVQPARLVFGSQCLAKEVCVTWEPRVNRAAPVGATR